jgi:hypothetical protein
MVITRVGVVSLGKLMGLMYAPIGLLFGLLFNLAVKCAGGLELEVR